MVSLCTMLPLIRGASAFAMQQFPYLYVLNLDREATLIPPAQIIFDEQVACRYSGETSLYFLEWLDYTTILKL